MISQSSLVKSPFVFLHPTFFHVQPTPSRFGQRLRKLHAERKTWRLAQYRHPQKCGENLRFDIMGLLIGIIIPFQWEYHGDHLVELSQPYPLYSGKNGVATLSDYYSLHWSRWYLISKFVSQIQSSGFQSSCNRVLSLGLPHCGGMMGYIQEWDIAIDYSFLISLQWSVRLLGQQITMKIAKVPKMLTKKNVMEHHQEYDGIPLNCN